MTDAKPDLLALAQSALADLKREQEYAAAFDVPIRYYIETAAALAEGVVELTRERDAIHAHAKFDLLPRAEAAEARLAGKQEELEALAEKYDSEDKRVHAEMTALEARLAEVERDLAEADDVIVDFWGPKWSGRDKERINHSIVRHRSRQEKTTTKDTEAE